MSEGTGLSNELDLHGYISESQECGTETEKQIVQYLIPLYDLALAQDHYRTGMIERATRDMKDAVAAVESIDTFGDAAAAVRRRKFSTLFLFAQAYVQSEMACRPEQFLTEDNAGADEKREEMLDEAISALSTPKAGESTSAREHTMEREYKTLESGDLWTISLRATLLADSPRSDSRVIADALAEASDAAGKRPFDWNLKEAVGTLELREGNLDNAVRNLRDAVILSPSNPQFHYLLGFGLMEKGEVRMASDEWKYARALDPERWQYIDDPLEGCGPILGRARPSRDLSSGREFRKPNP